MSERPRAGGPPGRSTPAEIELWRLALPLRSPHHAAHGVERVRPVTLVQVTLPGGAVGWGECSALTRPTYTSEYADEAFRVLAELLAPASLAGQPVPVVGHPMAAAALEGAETDAALRARGESLGRSIGATREVVDCAAVVSGSSVDDVLATITRRLRAGYRAVSVKIRPGFDLAPLRAVRVAWPELELAADANGSYADPDAVPRDLDDLGLTHLEQPLHPSDFVGLGRLGRRLVTPLALDESIASRHDLDTAAALGAGRIINLKPARVGGTRRAAALAARAREIGMEVFCGGLLETGVGRAHALAVAGLPACVRPTHLGPSDAYFDRDVTDPFVLESGARLRLPLGPGIGVAPDAVALDSLVVDRLKLERRRDR